MRDGWVPGLVGLKERVNRWDETVGREKGLKGVSAAIVAN